MVFNLVDLCIFAVMKTCNFDIVSDLLFVQFPNSVSSYIFSHYPLNFIFINEKNPKYCSIIKKIWKHVIEKCASKSHILKAKLEAPIDSFEFWRFLQKDDDQLFRHQRQVLVNALFLEALEKADFNKKHSSINSECISLPLHDSLEGNSPNICDEEWLTMLSCKINSFNFYQSKVNFLLANEAICHSIAQHAKFINLKLITCLDDCEETKPIFSKVYCILCTMLSKNRVKRVSIDRASNSNATVELVKLCCGQCDDKYFQTLKAEKDNLNGSFKITDIWDDALGQDFIVPSEIESLDAADSIYENFSSVNETSIQLSSERYNCTRLNLRSITELDFDMSVLDFKHFANAVGESNLINLKKLGLGVAKFAPVANTFHCAAEAISIIEKLLANRDSNLSVLKLTSFVFVPHGLKSLSNALKQSFELRCCKFEELALMECSCFENAKADYYLDLNICSCSYLGTLFVKSVKVYESQSFEIFLHCLKPFKVCIVGNCICNGIEDNLELLEKAFHYSYSLTNGFQSFVVELPITTDTEKIKKFCNALCSINFTSLLVIHHGFVPPVVLDCLKQFADNVVFVRSNISTIQYSLTKEEFLSQM